MRLNIGVKTFTLVIESEVVVEENRFEIYNVIGCLWQSGRIAISTIYILRDSFSKPVIDSVEEDIVFQTLFTVPNPWGINSFLSSIKIPEERLEIFQILFIFNVISQFCPKNSFIFQNVFE